MRVDNEPKVPGNFVIQCSTGRISCLGRPINAAALRGASCLIDRLDQDCFIEPDARSTAFRAIPSAFATLRKRQSRRRSGGLQGWWCAGSWEQLHASERCVSMRDAADGYRLLTKPRTVTCRGLDIQRASEHGGHPTLSPEETHDDGCGEGCPTATARLHRLGGPCYLRSLRGRRRSNSGFAFRVDQDRSTRWRRHLHAMLIASEGVCNIPVVQAR